MEIEFAGRYDRETVFQAVRLANKPSRLSSVLRIGSAILLAGLFAGYLIAFFRSGQISSTEIVQAGRLLLTVPFILYIVLQPYLSSRRLAGKIWKDPAMRMPVTGTISGQGIRYLSSTQSPREMDWSLFAKRQVVEDLIVLLTADGLLSFFPRNFFKTENDWRVVLQWVNARVAEAR